VDLLASPRQRQFSRNKRGSLPRRCQPSDVLFACRDERPKDRFTHPGWRAQEIVAGASDNDPTNVGTAVAVGARTSYHLAWVAVLVGPLLAVVQAIAAQVGTVARDDLQALTLRRYGRRVAAVLMASMIVVNLVTIAADLQAGAAGIGLLTGVDSRGLSCPWDWGSWVSCVSEGMGR